MLCLSCIDCRTLMVDLIVSSGSSETPKNLSQPGGVALTDLVSSLRMCKRKSEAGEYYSEVASDAVKSRASADDFAEARLVLIKVECASVSQLAENIRERALSQSFHEQSEEKTPFRKEVVKIREEVTRILDAQAHGHTQLMESLERLAEKRTESMQRLDNTITELADARTRRFNEQRDSQKALRDEVIGRMIVINRRLGNLVDEQTQMREQLIGMNGRLGSLVDGQTQMKEQLIVMNRRLGNLVDGQTRISEQLIIMDRKVNKLSEEQTRLSEQLILIDKRISQLCDGQTQMREELSGQLIVLNSRIIELGERQIQMRDEITAKLTELEVNIKETIPTSIVHSNQEELRALQCHRRA